MFATLRSDAGFADDSTPDDGPPTPQFNLAFGLTDGKHDIEIAECSYPSLPPVPPGPPIQWQPFSRLPCAARQIRIGDDFFSG